jgi:hypothetical protein
MKPIYEIKYCVICKQKTKQVLNERNGYWCCSHAIEKKERKGLFRD